MDGDIVFYIHGDTIEYGGELFSTGELTADILNLSLKDYQCSLRRQHFQEFYALLL